MEIGTGQSQDDAAETPASKSKKSSRRAEGQVIGRGPDKFLLRIFIGKDSTGKMHYFNETFRGKKKAAGERLRELIEKKHTNQPLRIGNDTLNTFLDNWLKSQPDLKPSTLRLYGRILGYYVRPELGGMMLARIVAEDLQAHYARLADRGLAASTITLVHVLLKSAFTLAVERRKLAHNPMAGVKAPGGKRLAQEQFARREARTMTAEQAAQFLAAANESRFGVLFELAFQTGARPGELLALRWSDLDAEGRQLHIRQGITFIEGGRWYLDEPKTAHGRRTLRLSIGSVESLGGHRRRQLEERMKVGRMWNDHGFIFADELGEPYSQNRIRYYFKQLLKAADLPENFSPYSVRHTVATTMADEGVHPKAAAARLGHANTRTTLDIYTRSTAGMDDTASDALSRAISGRK
ncbi:MAG: tyrosine-type recombinase/integrase [Blastocatellia bacterium]